MVVTVVLILIGLALTTTSLAVFATLQLLVVVGELRNRPAFLLVLVPVFTGLAVMMAANLRNLLSST